MDIEWAWEGGSAVPAILQARPETVHSRPVAGGERERGALVARTRAVLAERGRVLVQGTSIGTQIVRGTVRVLRSLAELGGFSKGDILVTERTDPDWEPVMQLAAGIVTERGGRTCHAAIVSRELGVPAIVGAPGATHALKDGQAVTLCCAEGERGTVYEGFLRFYNEPLMPAQAGPLRTKLHLNISNPAAAFRLSPLPSDGVGLVREEFLLAGEIGIHPLALLNHAKLPAPLREQIAALTHGYPDKREFFVGKLSEGVGQIAAAFFPRPVLLRFSDLKTNEYAHLVGGHDYEATEENPMLGFRGASRYLDAEFREAFALECEAVRRVREGMGLKNLRVMVPFCRTPSEGERVLEEMSRGGLVRGRDGLEVWMMCEIPSNVLLANEFCPLFDGFSIGSNDLTQLTLGVDRDSTRLAHLFDERSPAVKRLISDFIRTASDHGRPVGICGQAPSDYPEFARFLVETGITSISVDPDALYRTRETVHEAERSLNASSKKENSSTRS
jgi:pyruvate,water dikinase